MEATDSIRAVVLGGINCDISASSYGPVAQGTSVPGVVSMSPGGVGRNIAHSMALLDVGVALCGSVGTDPIADWVLQETGNAGVHVSAVRRDPLARTSMYVSTLEQGELSCAVADMAGTEAIQPDNALVMLEAVRRLSDRLLWLVIDCNLLPETMQAAVLWARKEGLKVAVEPVSVAKSARLSEVAERIDVVTPNSLEAAAMCRDGAANDATWFVTRGARGVAHWQPERPGACALLAARPAPTVNANGAGDAFVAGLVAGLIETGDEDLAMRWGMAAGAITAGCQESVAPALSRAALLQVVQDIP